MADNLTRLSSEIDVRVKHILERKNAAASPPTNRGWQPDQSFDNADPSFDFGVLSLGEYGDPVTLSGDVKVKEGAGIEIARESLAPNTLSFGLSQDAAELIGAADSSNPAKLTYNNTGNPVLTVFRLHNALYALTAAGIFTVNAGTQSLVAVPGAVPAANETFTCARVFGGWAFIGTSVTNGAFLNIYRFDGLTLAAEMSLPAIGLVLAVAGMTVCAATLYALVADIGAANAGWVVLERRIPGTWLPLLPWQRNEIAGTISALSGLIVTANAGPLSKVYSLLLVPGQVVPAPVLDTPNANPMVLLQGAEAARREDEALVTDGSAIQGIASAAAKSHTGASIRIRDLFMQPSPYATPAAYLSVDATKTAFGIEACGLFIFGVWAKYRIDNTPTFEEWSYVFGYDGAEITEIAHVANPGLPYLRPVEADGKGYVYFRAETPADAPYVFRSRQSLKTALAYCGRHMGPR